MGGASLPRWDEIQTDLHRNERALLLTHHVLRIMPHLSESRIRRIKGLRGLNTKSNPLNPPYQGDLEDAPTGRYPKQLAPTSGTGKREREKGRKSETNINCRRSKHL